MLGMATRTGLKQDETAWFLFWIPGKSDAMASVELGDLPRIPTWFLKGLKQKK